jgi:opacity protein-like surface antigen
MYRHLRVSAAVLFALPLSALAANDPWNAPFTLQIGVLDAKADTTVRLDSNGGRLGTSLSFEGDLGVDEKKALPTFDMSWRINPYHGIEASYVSLKRDGARPINGTINWGEVTFPVSTVVNSTFDSDIIRLAYRYSFFNTGGSELSVLAGIHYTKLSTSLAGAGGVVASQEASVKYPLPTIGARYSGRFADNWRITGFGQLLKLKINEYDGEVLNLAGGVEWAFAPNMFGGLGYDYYKYSLSSTKDNARGEFEFRFDGPKLYFGWSF